MSFTTRCPACGTMFRVVPDQLKISDGWVRCGHCADVFDATLYLETWAPAVPAAPAAPAPPVGTRSGTPPAVGAEDAVDLAIEPVMPPGAAAFADRQAETSSVAAAEPIGVAAMVDGGAPFVDAATEASLAESPMQATTALDLPVSFWEPEPDPEPLSEAPTSLVQVLAFHQERAPLDVLDAEALGEQQAEAVADQNDDGARFDGPLHTEEPKPEVDVTGSSDDVQAPDFPGGWAHEPGPPSRPTEASEAAESDFQSELQRFAGASASASAASEPVPDANRSGNAVASVRGELSEPEPGFVRQARRRAFWRSPGVRVLLSCGALLLTVALVLQWALHERDALAAWQPRLAPVLSQLCAPMGCEVMPVRRIDAIVIDSSALTRRLGQFYSFDLVLKNTAPVALAVPALELSLTDSRDNVIARRVFLPEELPGAPASLPAQETVSISLRLSLAVGEAMPMAGYRALVFYP